MKEVRKMRKSVNTKLVLAALAAGIALISTGCGADVNLNIDGGEGKNYSASFSETKKEDSTSEENQEPAVTEVSEAEAQPEETTVTIISAEEENRVTENAPEETAAPSVNETNEKKDLKNLKNDLLPDMKNQSGWNDMMHSKGFNDEQIYLLYASEIFSKFADNVSANMTPEYDRGDSTFLTGYSYESFLELMNFFFTEDAEYRIMSGKEYYVQSPFKYYSAENDNGELRILGATPVCSNPLKAEPEVTESTDTSLKFTYVCSCRAEEYEISEYTEKYDSPEDVIAAFNADNTGEYYGNAFAGLVYDEETGYMRQYKYDEEMVKTEDGWKFRVYTDYKRF